MNVTPLSKKSKKKNPKDYSDHLKKFLNALNQTFEHDIHAIYLHFCAWVSRIESHLLSNTSFKASNPENYETILQYRSKLLISG